MQRGKLSLFETKHQNNDNFSFWMQVFLEELACLPVSWQAEVHLPIPPLAMFGVVRTSCSPVRSLELDYPILLLPQPPERALTAQHRTITEGLPDPQAVKITLVCGLHPWCGGRMLPWTHFLRVNFICVQGASTRLIHYLTATVRSS